MKKNYLFGWIKFFILYSMVSLWVTSANAQCPTINNPSPTILDASGYTFADLSADYVTDGGNGIAWYNAASAGNAISNTDLLQEGTYYVDDNSGSCGVRQSINVNFQVDPVPSGASLDKFYCSNDNETIQDYIDDALALYVPSGGNVNVYYDDALTNLANPIDVIAVGIINYYIVFVDNLGNRSQIEFGDTFVVISAPDPTPSNVQVFCNDPSINLTIADLDPGTILTFRWYQNLDGFGNPISPALPASTALVNGNTYYVIVDSFCDSNPEPVTVIINDPYDPGTSATLDYCDDNIPATPFNLFDELGGTPDTNGIWSGPLPTSNGNLGTVNISSLTTGIHTFTYTVPANGVCPQDTANITITIHETLTSGTVSPINPATFCESTASTSFDLFSLIESEDAGGQWTLGTLSSDPIVVNPSTIDLSVLTPATYNYTYTQNLSSPCPDESTTVQVIILADPNAGIALNQTFCENDLASNSPFNLFDALNGQDNNSGTWTDSNNATVTDPSNLNINGFTVGGSPYSFNYTINNGTCSDTETITITVQTAPDSGTPIITFPEFCEGAAPANFNLFDLLTGEDQAGTWYVGTNNFGATITNPVDLSAYTANTYNFTYDVTAVGSCDDVLVTVSITINDIPAPTALATQEFCDSATVADLVATGTIIQWYDNVTGGIPLAGTAALVNGEDYFASQTNATTGCESSLRMQVIATIYQSPTAGNVGTPIIACNNTSIDLNIGLDSTQDIGGTWYEGADNTGTVVASPTAFDVTGFIPGTYQFTYYVTANAPCDDNSTTITVTVEEPLSAGTDGVLDVCSNNGTTDLFTLIGTADVGGSWSPALASGTGVFDPLVDASGTYTYTLTNACGTFSSDVVVTVTQAPNAGTDNTANICVIDGVTDLFQFLGSSAQIGGTWSPALTSGTGAFDPLIDTAGVYTYTVTAIAPCSPDSSAQITVTIGDSPAPIVLDSNPEFCQADNPTVLDLNAAIRVTGSVNWYADAASTLPLNITDALVNGEDYFARQTSGSGCESSQSVQITATVNDVVTPTLINPNLELCINDGPTILELIENITEYNSNLNNVNWYDSATSLTPLSSSSLLIYGITYYATLYDATTGCESSVRLAYEPDLTSCGELVLPDGFSPNGDGTNDTFDYNNLDIIHSNFDIQIFNRYGTVVYQGNANSPRFDGTSNQGGIGNKQLPTGVYFFIFNFNDGVNKPKQGRLYLSR